ncbi:hypothetical protein CCR75_005436 [Bremia lactucae]|uniref:Uncharacterized protein n=1 Tax=Bremia lactucae TaxID=4779 RepID=A0A976FGB0_BRELC|nr:hypothetical protein CCR75_005436 [Bremia lactucae]
MELSEYEAKRQRRIEANQRVLQALHVIKIPRHTSTHANKKKELHPVRRSLRQLQQTERAAELEETEIKTVMALRELPSRRKRSKVESLELVERIELFNLPISPLSTRNQGKTVHLSSSQISIELENFHSQWLGTQLLPMGKNTVMQSMCPPGYVAKFSKMSGVQPWKNAIALFVNLESDSPYDNVFRHEVVNGSIAVYFQWFGQHRWHDESPLVRRLRNTERGSESLRFHETYNNKSDINKEPVLLFLRQTQNPYIYCGRLGYLGHLHASKPLEFRWQLLDADSLHWENLLRKLTYSE